MRIASIVGARPQFVKLAPLHREIVKAHRHIILHTGQHYDYQMSQVFFEELKIPEPDHNLGIGSGGHGEQTGRMLSAIEGVLLEERPDMVVVYGDTNSTLAGALAATKLLIPVAHVEAGLRSFRRGMPEEINRVLTDHMADILLCPTELAMANLRKEGVSRRTHLVGDPMAQVLLEIEPLLDPSVPERCGTRQGDYVLATIHRQENADSMENMTNIIDAMLEYPGDIVLPLHPRTAKNLRKWDLMPRLEGSGHIRLLPPQGFLTFTSLEKHARMIMTDSGGVQKEAYVFRVPCVTVRDETEWVETLQDGWNVLTGAQKERIAEALLRPRPTKDPNLPYGDRDVSRRIVLQLESFHRP
jgi:UDP-N-acetylglucosamine 2-epimerase